MSKLRRDKLNWCANHNQKMQKYRASPVQYLLFNMPKFLASCQDNIANASDKLSQYLSSPKPSYWQKSRQHTIDELCQALSLPLAIWNLPDLDSFIASAKVEYQQQDILIASMTVDYQLVEPLLPRLYTLAIKDGKEVIKFDIVDADKTLGFRRKKSPSKDIVLRSNDEVRINFHSKSYSQQSGYGLLFSINPANKCIVIVPTQEQSNTAFEQGVIYIPPLNEQMLYPPTELGCHQLYALAAKNKLSIFDDYDGETPISPIQFQQLIDFCNEELKHGGNLYRIDFYVE